MEEALRLDYLAAMDIVQYVARAPLPGACPSTVMYVEPPEEKNDTVTLVAPSSVAPARIAALLDDKEPAKPVSATVKSTPVSVTQTLAITHHCQIAIWAMGELLIIADAPRLDNSQLTLLRNILQAIGIQGNLPDVKQFNWPLPQRKDKSLLAAREHFQGMLDAGLLKQPGLRQILCFGNAANTLLIHDDSQTGNDSGIIPLRQYFDWPVINACSLQEMLVEPLRKADTWRALQVLVRH